MNKLIAFIIALLVLQSLSFQAQTDQEKANKADSLLKICCTKK